MAGEELNADVLDRAVQHLAAAIASDPRPPAAIRVGGIGHREIPQEVRGRIKTTAASALKDIERAFRKAQADPWLRDHYLGEPVLAVITPLAEGADRLISQSAEGDASPWRLGAILPFEKSAYEKTFDLDKDPTAAIEEFGRLLKKAGLPSGYGTLVLDGASDTEKARNAGYSAASSAIVRWSDILIAIVDDARPDSMTGDGLKEAIAWKVPVIVIDPSHPDRYGLLLDGAKVPDDADVTSALDNAVARLFGIRPAAPAAHGVDMLKDYLTEHVGYDAKAGIDFEHKGPYAARTVAPFWIAWGAAVNRTLRDGFKSVLLPKQAAGSSIADVRGLPFNAAGARQFASSFLYYSRADALARLYGELHRGVQIVSAVVGILAALAALIHLLGEQLPAAAFTLFEFACLLFMFAAVKTSHRQRWLQRWIDYRLLAEIMRNAKFLALTGRPTPFSDQRWPLTGEDAPQRHWVDTHVRALLRAQTLSVPGRSAVGTSDTLSAIRAYVSDRLVLDQLRYHSDTATYERSLDARLRKTLEILTPVTIALIGVKFFAEAWLPATWLHQGLAVPLILLPAITSTIIAMRGGNQYAVTARRSDGMVVAMRLYRKELAAVASFHALGECSADASRTLLGEVEGWTDVFSDRHIEIEV